MLQVNGVSEEEERVTVHCASLQKEHSQENDLCYIARPARFHHRTSPLRHGMRRTESKLYLFTAQIIPQLLPQAPLTAALSFVEGTASRTPLTHLAVRKLFAALQTHRRRKTQSKRFYKCTRDAVQFGVHLIRNAAATMAEL